MLINSEVWRSVPTDSFTFCLVCRSFSISRLFEQVSNNSEQLRVNLMSVYQRKFFVFGINYLLVRMIAGLTCLSQSVF